MATGNRADIRSAQLPWYQDIQLFWLLLTLPAVYLVLYGVTHHPRPLYLRHTGLIACWLLIVALAITPLGMLFGAQPWVRWLRARRRYLGVATFCYVVLHMIAFLNGTPVAKIFATFTRWQILTGWIAFVILLAMALTSNEAMVRRLGRNWKKLQQWIYLAAPLILLHWVFTEKHYLEVAIYVAPLLLLTLWRLTRRRNAA